MLSVGRYTGRADVSIAMWGNWAVLVGTVTIVGLCSVAVVQFFRKTNDDELSS